MNLEANGKGCVFAWRAERHLAAATEALDIVGRRARDGGEPVRLPELGEVWLKGGPLRRHAAWRHGTAWRLLRRPPPRVAECLRLAELECAGVPAAEPLFAVAEFRGVRCLRQALVLRLEAGAEPFAAALARSDERRTLLVELATLVAKLHGSGFEHRDLYLRNVLMTARGLRLLDLWRPAKRIHTASGLGPARSAAELAQLLFEAEPLLEPAERSLLLATYLDLRAEHPPRFDTVRFDTVRFEKSIERARERVLATHTHELRRAAKKGRATGL